MTVFHSAAYLILANALGACVAKGEDTYPYPGWNLAFKASRGNNQSVVDLWTSSRFTSNPTPLETALNSHCGCHFKSRFVERWASLNIKKVAVALYEQDNVVPKKVLHFDGRGSTKMNWFTWTRLTNSSWSDLMTTRLTNRPLAHGEIFSIYGDNRKAIFRRFYINKWYQGCDNVLGWTVIVDAGTGPCKWDTSAGYWPAFVYCDGTSKCNITQKSKLSFADVFAIFIYV